MKNKIIIITGPTATGKSHLSLELAKQYNGEIINSDSLQIYKDNPILAATPLDYQNIPHHLYGFLDLDQHFSVGKFITQAEPIIKQIIDKNKIPIITGGTPMYIKLLSEGISEIPEFNQYDIDKYEKILQKKGLSEMYKELINFDPRLEFININDKNRILKMYMLKNKHNISVMDLYKKNKKKPLEKYQIIKILLLPEKEITVNRCHERFLNMLKNGAIEEVRNIISIDKIKNRTFMKTIGLNEITSYLNNEINKDEMIDKVAIANRKLIKKQFTWFNNKFSDFNKIHQAEPLLALKEFRNIIENIIKPSS